MKLNKLTTAEENYLKAIFKIAEMDKKSVSTNALAAYMCTAPASVTDMIKRLYEKSLIIYTKYKGVTLSSEGNKIAIGLIRKHRLWEVFLVEKLRFSWENIHDIAEQLEHIHSEELLLRLDAFLNYPKYDPHGEPIPNNEGKFTLRSQLQLSELSTGITATVIGVKDSEGSFLKHLNTLKIKLGAQITIVERIDFDGSMKLMVEKKDTHTISSTIAQNLLVKRV